MGKGGRSFLAGDGLRAIAAIAVLVFHCALVAGFLARRTPDGPDGQVWDVFMRLDVGVIVFFVLSGYLVGGPFVRAWLADEPAPDVWRYAERRLRRIVPAFWVVSALALIWFGVGDSTPREVAMVFSFAQVYDWSAAADVMRHAWTLDAELAFYLLLPLTFLLLRPVPRPARPRVLAVGLVAVVAAGIVVQSQWSIARLSSLAFSPVGLSLYFVPGLVLAAIEDHARPRLAARGGRATSIALLAMGTGAFALSTATASPGLDAAFDLLVGAGVVGAAMTWEWTTGRAPLRLDGRIPSALGRWSYGIYLIHAPVTLYALRSFPAVERPWLGFLAVLGLTLVVTIPAAAASWRFIERRALHGERRREAALPHQIGAESLTAARNS